LLPEALVLLKLSQPILGRRTTAAALRSVKFKQRDALRATFEDNVCVNLIQGVDIEQTTQENPARHVQMR
jgi:hypothetical protein